ncbi:protein TIME FOR COFFEE-like isoform X3 [Aristolochia californica]|uniref:protein TIME FOR COFFEE-like isoform X3 n=1 Tax=Aristolochia californica TaxID=171875 RepID=UPI0035DA60DA
MERNREARRGTMAATANGLSRRRQQRSSSLRDSPEEEGAAELPESVRLRDRSVKKDRDRDRDRDRERDRDRDKDRERDRDRSSRGKRRRGDRILHGSRDEGGDNSSEESLDDEEEDEEEAVRLPPSMNQPSSSSLTTPNLHRKSFTPKIVKSLQWKAPDEMIGVPVPRKARSASVKRSHECWVSGAGVGGGGGDPVIRQASMSPARPAASTAPISPSSSNASTRKKMKPIGSKHRPPKISKTSSSSIQEIEIEVAEVLYGLTRQFQCPSKPEIVNSKDTNGLTNDAKSGVSSPNSTSPPPPGAAPVTTSSPAAAKRKRPRHVKYEEENPSSLASPNASAASAAKTEVEQPSNGEISSPKQDKVMASALENGGGSFSSGGSLVASVPTEEQKDPIKTEDDPTPDLKLLKEETERGDEVEANEETVASVKESPLNKSDIDLEDATTTKKQSAGESLREEKFNIDLMALPSVRSSPERDSMLDLVIDENPPVPKTETMSKSETVQMEVDNVVETGKPESAEMRSEEKKSEILVEEVQPQKQAANERHFGLQLDIEKQEKDMGLGSSKQQSFKQTPKAPRSDNKTEKSAQSGSLALQMPVGGWPGGLPPLGYMGQIPALQAVVPVDGNAGSSTHVHPPHFHLQQSRSKRCATHFFIAQSIHYNQQLARMNPFWPTAASSTSLYGGKQYNLNLVPPTEAPVLGNTLQGNFGGKNLSSSHERGLSAAFPGQTSKEKNPAGGAAAATFMDAAQRKQQLLLQPGPQTGSGNNMLQAPAIIFPMGQQQAAAVPRLSSAKSATSTGIAAPAMNAGNSVPGAGTPASSSATTLSFNYANVPANEAQYLAILQNNGYPFPIPTHVGAPPPYRGGSHPQAVPFFNGSFYSSQMLHHSQLQQQPQTQTTPAPSLAHQNTSTSSGSSSSQKQRLQGCSSNNGGPANSHSFPAAKQRAPPTHLPPHQARQFEVEIGSEDSPSTADSRISRSQKNASVIYNHNFAMPIHPQNFALMSPAALGGGNHTEKQPSQQQNVKGGGMELTASQAFAMSFASPGLDFSSMPSNHAIFQNLPEAARQSFQMAAAAAAAAAGAQAVSQQKKSSNPASEEGKSSAADSINQKPSTEEERKKSASSISHSLAFSRPEGGDHTSILGSSVIDSSNRTLNLIQANGNRGSRSSPSNSTAPSNISHPTNSMIQLQKQQQQQLQQQQLAARTKAAATSNTAVYSDRLPAIAKFPNSISVFPQALVQGNSPTQSGQWKTSTTRSTTVPIASPAPSSVKNLPQQQSSRTQQSGVPATQISFGVNSKTSSSGQQHFSASSNPSQPSIVGSPSAKGSGGSPRTTACSKPSPILGPGPTGGAMSSQPAKNSPSSSGRKSSPSGSGRNLPSVLGSSHISSVQSSNPKSQHQQGQQQTQHHQQQKSQSYQPGQIFFSNTYMQAQSPQSATTNSASSGYYQRRPTEQQAPPPQQHQQNSSAASSGMMSLCGPSLQLSGGATSDPAKAVAAAQAAASNLKGLPPPALLHAAQFAAQSAGGPHPLMSPGYPYMHAVPAAPVKSGDHKPAAGNDNLHPCWQPEKR